MAALLRAMPRRVLIFLADCCGGLLYSVFRVRRRVIDEQLAIAFGASRSPRERRLIGRRAWQSAVLTFFEFLQPSAGFRDERQLFAGEPDGLAHAQPLLGSATIMATGHIGNWEAMAALLPPYGVRMLALAKALHNPLVQARVLRDRARHPNLEILLVNSSLKPVVEAARDGKWITFLTDQDARRSGIFVDFFGRPASTATGAAYFSWKLQLPILPVFCVREPAGLRRVRVIVHPPIFPNPNAPRDSEIERLTQAHTKALESVVAAHPEDYFWLHRRWKTRPKSEKRL